MTSNEDLQVRVLEEAVKKKFDQLNSDKYFQKKMLEQHFEPVVEPIVSLKDAILAKNDPSTIKEEKVKTEDSSSTLSRYKDMIERASGYNILDRTYGVYSEETGKWKMGKYEVSFQDGDFVIGNGMGNFKLTPGLMNLLFLKAPVDYTEKDLNVYKSILLITEAHKTPNGRIKSSKGVKYTTLISKLFPKKLKKQDPLDDMMDLDQSLIGSGFKQVPKSKVSLEYIWFDDPNELVNRLKKLIASSSAGNNAHSNEITSILEELVELKLIKVPSSFRL